MTIRFLSVMGGATLMLAACGGSQEPGTVPADNPILQYEAPESGGEDDDLFGDDAFDDLDELDEADDAADPRDDEDDSAEGASKSTASDEGASARAKRDVAEGSGKAGQAE